MIDIDAEAVEQSPVDKLAVLVLRDLHGTKNADEFNYLLDAQRVFGDDSLAARAIAEALGWLRSHGLTAHEPGVKGARSIFVTRSGEEVLANGPTTVFALRRLEGGIHSEVASVAMRHFSLGEYEFAAVAAMKAVEVRVRTLGKFSESDYGVSLINKALGSNGPLADPNAVDGEREALRAFFAGAYGLFRNPSSHRYVDYTVDEASEIVHVASSLMRALDAIERRLA